MTGAAAASVSASRSTPSLSRPKLKSSRLPDCVRFSYSRKCPPWTSSPTLCSVSPGTPLTCSYYHYADTVSQLVLSSDLKSCWYTRLICLKTILVSCIRLIIIKSFCLFSLLTTGAWFRCFSFVYLFITRMTLRILHSFRLHWRAAICTVKLIVHFVVYSLASC